MLTVVESLRKLTVTLPHLWRAEDIFECRSIEQAMAQDSISDVTIDLSEVTVLNPATIWLIDHLQWNCVKKRKTFNIVATSRICDLYFKAVRMPH